MSEIIRTIDDMEKLYYSQAGQQFLQSNDVISPFMTKSDAPVITTTTGVYNAVYGAQAWVQLNQEANTVGLLPKFPWKRSGWRVITARTASLPYGGRAETATLPPTVKPTFGEVSTKPKLSAVTFQAGEVQEYLATQGGDDAFAAMADLRTYMAVEHKEDLNKQVNTQGGTLAANNFETIDRVTANYAELSNKESDQSTGFSAGDLDIYGQDRDGGASWADAYVSQTATSGTMRALTDSLLNSLLQNTLTNGANGAGQIIQTGYDSWSAINQLYDSQVRYNVIGTAKVQPGVNGVKTQTGTEVGIQVATLFSKPVIQSKDSIIETGGISRIYMLDLSNPEGFDLPRLCMKVAKPTQYFEAGINQGTPFAVNSFSTKGMYRTMGELICTFFKVQGKIRDLSS